MATITKETVMAVKKYTSKYPEMAQADIAKLCGTSASSVGNIQNGLYNHLLEENGGAYENKSIPSSVPYDEYKRLCLCELIVGELLKGAKPTLNGEQSIYIDYRAVSQIIKRYLPDEYEAKINEIYGE